MSASARLIRPVGEPPFEGIKTIVEETVLAGVRIITPRKLGDERGFFSETYNRQAFAAAGVPLEFLQDNQSLSAEPGTVRGLHFQAPPFAQGKLVRVLRGAIFDVVVDLRRSSPTFGQHLAVELSAANWRQLFIPIGFAHGFCTLERDTEVFYKVTNYYSAAHDRGLAWDDEVLGIAWPVAKAQAILSERDRRHPSLRDLATPFE
jgi:dTDP-4-dehydrorhamnose 3,5-epimerase